MRTSRHLNHRPRGHLPMLTVLTIAAALTIGGIANAAEQRQETIAMKQETSTMKLFKIVTPRDDIVIGLADDELRSFGPAADLDNLAQQLAGAKQLTVWQYAVRKGTNGELQQAPMRRIAVFASDTLRVEPYTTPLPVVMPATEAR